MDDEDVPSTEMRWFRPPRDEIDAVLGDDQLPDDDLIDVAAIVHELRSAYLSDEGLARHPALAAFTGALLDDNGDPLVTAASNAHGSAPQMAGLPNRAPEPESPRPMMKALSVLTAGVAGKIVVGAAVAAASVGGLHAAEVVNVPGLPDQANEQAVIATQTQEGSAQTQEEEPQLEEPEITPEAETEFSLAMTAWSECVDAASALHDAEMVDHDASEAGPPGRFDPEEACGERPLPPAGDGEDGQPREEIERFVTDIQAWAACVVQNAPDHAESCPPRPGAPGGTEGNAPAGTPNGPPAGTPNGPPEGTPNGPPEGTPNGPPEGTPSGPPEGTPSGPPEGTPSGPPQGAPRDI